MAVDTVALTIGLLSAFIVVVALAAQIRYSRYSKRVLKRQQRLKRADKLLDALAGTLRAVANPDATPATGLAPETDTLVRENTRSRDFAARGRRASRTRGVSNPNAPRGHVAPFFHMSRTRVPRFCLICPKYPVAKPRETCAPSRVAF